MSGAKHMSRSGGEQKYIVFGDAHNLLIDEMKPFTFIHKHNFHETMAMHLQIKGLFDPVKVKR